MINAYLSLRATVLVSGTKGLFSAALRARGRLPSILALGNFSPRRLNHVCVGK
jgi:hypothetical protein